MDYQHLQVPSFWLKTAVYSLLIIITCGGCSVFNKKISKNAFALPGYYTAGKFSLELKEDSTFSVMVWYGNGTLGEGVCGGTYITKGIKILMKVDSRDLLWLFINKEVGSFEEGYVDYSNGIIYAFDLRFTRSN